MLLAAFSAGSFAAARLFGLSDVLSYQQRARRPPLLACGFFYAAAFLSACGGFSAAGFLLGFAAFNGRISRLAFRRLRLPLSFFNFGCGNFLLQCVPPRPTSAFSLCASDCDWRPLLLLFLRVCGRSSRLYPQQRPLRREASVRRSLPAEASASFSTPVCDGSAACFSVPER